jgi:nucleotide-binding universal stress UspA family protein
MPTYLVGTDGVEASETLVGFLRETLRSGDRVEAVHVLTNSNIDEAEAGEAALGVFERALTDMEVAVETRQVNRGRSPAAELVELAAEVEADRVVTGLRQHSRTERIIFGSVSQSLVKQVDRPVTLVPLPSFTIGGEEIPSGEGAGE